MKRRDFLHTAFALGSAATVRGAQLVPASRPVPGTLQIGSRKQTLLDDHLIFEASRADSFMTRPQKHPGNPIMVPDRAWERSSAEDSGIQISGQCVLYDSDEKLFKMWYWVSRSAGQDQSKGRSWCYAVSSDGYRWEKPDLGLFEFEGSRKNNLISGKDFGGGDAYANVFKDTRDPDPQRRYKALGFTWGKADLKRPGLIVAFSPDGVRWTEHPGNPVVPLGREIADVPTMLGWDPLSGKYVYYPRPGHPLAPEIYGNGDHRHIRSIGYSTSDDFIHWSPTLPMLTPDVEDRNDYQYMQIVTAVDGEFYVGLNAMYETHEQTWDIFLMSSRDGFNWNWVDRKLPFLGRSEYPGYDAGYMAPSGPIFHGDRVWIYYGAFSGAHSFNPSKLGANRFTIALCTLPRNRWRGLMAGPHRATVVTRPLIFEGSRLRVDLDAGLPMQEPRVPPRYDECEVRAALEDQSGGRIEGFTLEHSTVLRSSGEQEITWAGADIGRLAGKPVRIRFEMHSAALYSIQFTP